MTQNAKTQEMQMSVFVQNRKKMEMEIFALCVITFEPIRIETSQAPQNDRLDLSVVKDENTYDKKMAGNDRTIVIYQYLSFPIRL